MVSGWLSIRTEIGQGIISPSLLPLDYSSGDYRAGADKITGILLQLCPGVACHRWGQQCGPSYHPTELHAGDEEKTRFNLLGVDVGRSCTASKGTSGDNQGVYLPDWGELERYFRQQGLTFVS